MNKLYNTNYDIAMGLHDFFKKIDIPLSEYRFELLTNLIISLINSESGVISDITKNFKVFSDIQDESLQKKIRRFFDSPKFFPYKIYDKIIKHVIDNYKVKHNNNNVHIILDHSFCKDDFTVFMITMRLGEQSIPLYFRCFNGTNDPDAFDEDFIIKSIDYIYNLFKDKDYNLIFLADRWFPNTRVLTHINNLNCTYVFRTKKDHKIRYFDKKEGHYIWKQLSEFKHKKYISKFFDNVDYTFNHTIKANIVLGRTDDTDEPWILVTNGNSRRAVKDYSYRFGAIECNFKNNKTNGFYLESTKLKKLSSFIGIYFVINIATLWLTIIGADYVKNKNQLSKRLKIRDTKKTKSGNIKRIISLFNLGLTLFNKLQNNIISISIKCNFILYDV